MLLPVFAGGAGNTSAPSTAAPPVERRLSPSPIKEEVQVTQHSCFARFRPTGIVSLTRSLSHSPIKEEVQVTQHFFLPIDIQLCMP